MAPATINALVLAVAAVGAGMAGAGTAHAVIVSIPASADAYVDGQNASPDKTGNNYGTLNQMYTRFYTGITRNERAYIRFDLPNDIATINSASLSLFSDVGPSVTKSVRMHGLTDETLDNWGESTITFANAPAGTSPATYGPDPTKSTLISSTSVPGGVNDVTVTFGTSANLVDFLSGDTNGAITLIITDSDDSGAYATWASRENVSAGAFAPTLTIDYNVPEPAGILAIAGLATTSLLRRRRCRSA